MRREHGRTLAVDHRIKRAAAIKLLFAFAQTEHRGAGVVVP